MVFRDCGWRTWLGTCFYDRVSEAEEVAKSIAGRWVVLIVGPRNAGKSELARYVLAGRLGVRFVYVDARLLRLKGALEQAVNVARGVDRGFLLGMLRRLLERGLNIGGLVDAVLEAFKRLGSEPYLVIDEFNYLGDIDSLEALAKAVSFYPEYSSLHLVITSSEGFLMDYLVLGRLTGYRVHPVFVGEMPVEEFKLLYEEYCGKSGGCRVDLDEYLSLVGCFPGYLREVADLDREGLRVWMERHRAMLEEALQAIASRVGSDPDTVAGIARKLLCEGLKPGSPLEYSVARELVRANIAYPIGFTHRYKPQLRVYASLLCGRYGGL